MAEVKTYHQHNDNFHVVTLLTKTALFKMNNFCPHAALKHTNKASFVAVWWLLWLVLCPYCMFACGPAAKCWGSSWRREVQAVRESSRWPQASVSPSWGWTNTPLCSKSWRGTWRLVSRHVTSPLFNIICAITCFLCVCRRVTLTGQTYTSAWPPSKTCRWAHLAASHFKCPQTEWLDDFKAMSGPLPPPLSPHQTQCQEVRKRKELELQILTESIRLWEGDDIKTLGSVLYMSQVLVQSPGSEVPAKHIHLLLPRAA